MKLRYELAINEMLKNKQRIEILRDIFESRLLTVTEDDEMFCTLCGRRGSGLDAVIHHEDCPFGQLDALEGKEAPTEADAPEAS